MSVLAFILCFLGGFVFTYTLTSLNGRRIRRSHDWHVRQTAARRILEPVNSKRAELYPSLYGNACRERYCSSAAKSPCGTCWDHCDKCVVTEAAKKQLQQSIAALERDNGIGGAR